jgi:hypothetical protein
MKLDVLKTINKIKDAEIRKLFILEHEKLDKSHEETIKRDKEIMEMIEYTCK